MLKRKEFQPIYSQTYQKKRRYLTLIGVFLLLIILLLGGYLWNKHSDDEFANYPIKGIEISQDDGYLDFNELKAAGFSFVYLRATQGASYSDDNFETNYQRSQGSQLAIGVYHVYSFSSSVNQQFNNFTNQVNYETGILPIMLSIDYYGQYNQRNIDWDANIKKIDQFIQKVNNYYNRPVVICMPYNIEEKIKKSVTDQKIWLVTDQVEAPKNKVVFISTNDENKVTLKNKGSISLNKIAFNGNKVEWGKYINSLNR